jgi:hypothetical protein
MLEVRIVDDKFCALSKVHKRRKMDAIDRKIDEIDRRRPGMLRCCLSGPPAPRFVESYARRVGTNENSGKR